MVPCSWNEHVAFDALDRVGGPPILVKLCPNQ